MAINRLGLYGLEIAPEKTKILAFGPMAQQWAKEQGRRKAETFDFLGFTHYCTTSRNGKWFRVVRKTISRRLSVVKNVRPGLMLSDKTLRLVPKISGETGTTPSSNGLGQVINEMG